MVAHNANQKSVDQNGTKNLKKKKKGKKSHNYECFFSKKKSIVTNEVRRR